MPTTFRDYLAHGLEMGLVVGPPAVAAVAFALVLGWALGRRVGRGGAAPAALAMAYLAAHFAVGGEWADAFARPGAERLAVLALVALAVGLAEARLAVARGGSGEAARAAGIGAARLAGAVAVPWAIVPERLTGAEWWGTAAVLAVGTLFAMVVLGWAARRSDARAHLIALAPALGALGGLAIQYGFFATLGTRAMGLGVGAGVLAGAALLLGYRGLVLPADGAGAAAAVLGAGVLGAAQVHGSLPLDAALLAYAALLAPVVALGRTAIPRRRTAIAVVASLALLGCAAAAAEWSIARAAELEREKAKARAPTDGGYDPDYEYGPDADGSGSGDDLPY